MTVPLVPLKVAISPDTLEPGPLTLPEPDGVAHVASPRQNVEAEAAVPPLRLPTGRLPVTSLASRTVSVLLAPAIVLFVSVCVAARVATVSDDPGNVIVVASVPASVSELLTDNAL